MLAHVCAIVVQLTQAWIYFTLRKPRKEFSAPIVLRGIQLSISRLIVLVFTCVFTFAVTYITVI